ncbi:hypothetical protein KsCSTR_25750 [Candidatus Kuenenia stuttgartiensis]|jgi:mRNA interferase MazF|uniref:PemK-like protein n=2 Tax=Candidatus Kuenenia TaxID=380738 RepID=Q1Q727_KUEST|nr:type II toxin-antitoxin system PemK/MazF family toxin [Candidatus Kuenenia stuttgartiensis]MBE7549006.1 type II toxin-antitoxin system PemK/MazF family toxin [Planctomycetia bacterium]QII11954.1 hypothetical protein KsCSTR_25750 [Candidatus Kuenenia stuttgartiensis]CAJ73386.1 conserved hypothetical protein [Candidatus Kuenenia stuttgartiensis]SOH06478.1 hypothetical protein KSMBR1_4006 [Candidatus Kuenenia stuttgartiensis]
MTTYNFGEIILVRFPHTDLQDISKRPALILYDSGDQDILIARITTQEYTTGTDYKIVEWKSCGLLVESFIRISKQATIEKKYVIKPLGTLAEAELNAVKSIIKNMFKF